MTMIRKQLYLAPEQQLKLRSLAKRWGCTEAEVVRTAITRLPDPDSDAEARLREAGILIEPPADSDLLSWADLDSVEQEYEAWLRSREKPLGLLDALIEDREGRL